MATLQFGPDPGLTELLEALKIEVAGKTVSRRVACAGRRRVDAGGKGL